MEPSDPTTAVDVADSRPKRGRFGLAVRRFLLVVSVVLAGVGVVGFWNGWRAQADCEAAQSAVLLDMNVDVGAAGVHRGALKHFSRIACKQYIRMMPEVRAGEDAAALLNGLELTVTMRDAGGTETLAGAIPSPLAAADDDEGVMIMHRAPMAKGDYEIVVDVTKPSPVLAGRPVRFVSGYSLCGLEQAVVWVSTGIGVIAFVIAGVTGLGLWTTRRVGG